MTPQELKNSILQLVIQGKLVEQRPEEGTAAELLEKIFAAKNAKGAKKNLTQRRRARGEKATAALSVSPRDKIPDDEKPFDIPESWEWVRLGECSTYADKKEKVLPSKIRPDDWSLDLEDIEKDTGRIVEFRSAGDRRITGDKVVFRQGQILYSKLRPYLKKILVAPKDGICTPELVPFSTLGGIEVNYLVIVLKSPHIDFAINSVTYGVKMPRVGTDTMVNLPIPLPPLAEQKRIVAKIEELLPLIDRYEKAWSKLEDFNKRFPVDMQKSLLQMAIQGKLVEQRAEEGTGEELYRQIQAEKQRLVKSGKIKKEKPLPEITDDEKPFDIPEGWVWVRLGEIFTTSSGTTPSKSKPEYYLTPDYNWIRTTDLNNSVLQSCEIKISRKAFEDCRLSIIPQNSVCVAMYGGAGTIGKNAIIKFDTTINQSVCAIQPNGFCEMLFVQRFLQFYRPCWMKMAAGSRKDPNISQVIIKNALFPLPPLAEQKRIVAKLEELLPLCERLK